MISQMKQIKTVVTIYLRETHKEIGAILKPIICSSRLLELVSPISL